MNKPAEARWTPDFLSGWNNALDPRLLADVSDDPRSVFISYSWDNLSHMEWVRQIGDQLLQCGFRVILDQFLQFREAYELMATGLHCKNIIIVVTPSYCDRTGMMATFNKTGPFFEGTSLDEFMIIYNDLSRYHKIFTIYRNGPLCIYDFPIFDFSEHMSQQESFFRLNYFLNEPALFNRRHDKPWICSRVIEDGQEGFCFVPLDLYVKARRYSFKDVTFVSGYSDCSQTFRSDR